MPSTTGNNLQAVLGVIIAIFAISLFIPAAMVSLENPETQSLAQEESVITAIKNPVSSLITTIHRTPQPSYVNITLINTENGITNNTTNLNEGQTESLVLGAASINITLDSIVSNSIATVTYEYPVYVGWPDGVKTLFDNIILMFMVIIILFILGTILVIYGGLNND